MVWEISLKTYQVKISSSNSVIYILSKELGVTELKQFNQMICSFTEFVYFE